MAEQRRRLISRHADLASRYRTYLVDGGLEIDESSFYVVRRRRVLFDEVSLVTLHSQRRVAGFLLLMSLVLVFAASAVALSFTGEPRVTLPVWGLSLLSVLGAVLVLALPARIVTVHSERSTATLVFSRQRKARESFETIRRGVREAQMPPPSEIPGREGGSDLEPET